MIGRELAASVVALRTWLASPEFEGRPHGIKQQLFVSLTSYPPRFPTLALTIKSLLRQTVKPDGILLWIDRDEIDQLPLSVRRLERYGVTIRPCTALGPFSKIVHALQGYPDAVLVTADDDVSYPPTWLRGLVEASASAPGQIVCYSARRIAVNSNGRLLPYRQWPRYPAGQGGVLMPTGYNGVLYPPNSLHPDVLDIATYLDLSPKADDLWLKWMSARVGTSVQPIPDAPPMPNWPGTQDAGLRRVNVSGGGNDRQAANLVKAFGMPQC